MTSPPAGARAVPSSRLHRFTVVGTLVLLSPCPMPVAPPVAAEAALVAPPPPPPPLPENPFADLCGEGCSARPGQPPRRLPKPGPVCVEGHCQREVVLAFDASIHVELDGRILEQTTTLERWSDLMTFQAYANWGAVYRCSGSMQGGATRLALVHRTLDGAFDGFEVIATPGDQRWPCEEVGVGHWHVGAVVAMNDAAVDEGIQQGYAALPKARADDDDDLTTWLRTQGYLPYDTELWRRKASGRMVDGEAEVVRPVSFTDLYTYDERGRARCDPWCTGRSIWTGPLRTRTERGLRGTAAQRFCAQWARHPGGEMAAMSDDRLVLTWPIQGACTPSWTDQSDMPRVPFTAPPTMDPRPRPDPALPKAVEVPWDLPARVQPGVRKAPVATEATLGALGAWIAATEPDPFLRAKAVHDWVATHIAYDVAAYRSRIYPPQDAEHVFTTRTGVCAGFANLVVALGEAAGVEFAAITGWARSGSGVEGHAWNALRHGNDWYLLDATWDAGSVDEAGFHAAYRTEWLFVRPEIFRATHHPEVEAWQLVADPEPPGVFQGRMDLGGSVTLLSPPSGTTLVDGDEVEVRVTGDAISAEVRAIGTETGVPCAREGGPIVSLRCPVEGPGQYAVDVSEDGRFVGQITVLR